MTPASTDLALIVHPNGFRELVDFPRSDAAALAMLQRTVGGDVTARTLAADLVMYLAEEPRGEGNVEATQILNALAPGALGGRLVVGPVVILGLAEDGETGVPVALAELVRANEWASLALVEYAHQHQAGA